MQYAERLPSLPSPKTIVTPLLALALGAAVATGTYALIDNDQVVDQPSSKVIVLDNPTTPGEGVSAKNEAGVAAAISSIPAPSQGVSAKNEAGTAAVLGFGSRAPVSEGVGAKDEAGVAAAISALELRGSKASAVGSSGSPALDAPTAQPDPAKPWANGRGGKHPIP